MTLYIVFLSVLLFSTVHETNKRMYVCMYVYDTAKQFSAWTVHTKHLTLVLTIQRKYIFNILCLYAKQNK